MIEKLNEINRILAAVRTLSHNSKGALETSVEKFCTDIVIEGRFPDHKSSIDFCVDIGIVVRSGDRLQLTKTGNKLMELNPQLEYELNENQKDLFTRNCLLSGKLRTEVVETFKQFLPAYASGTYQWSAVDNVPLTGNPNMVEIMRQAGLLRSIDGMLEVDQKYVALVRDILKPPHIVTVDEFILRLKNADVVGKIAEEIGMAFEKQRLQVIGCWTEAECIQKISDLDAAAGYDIASFDGQNLDMIHDRFIEVKGSTGTKVSFYWSRNEIEQAKSLGFKYWIYFVRDVDKDKRTGAQPIMINDPAKNILENDEFKVECQQLYVETKK